MASADPNSPRDAPPSPPQRRSSFVDMFNPRGSISSQSQPPRRLSITTLGLSTLPNAQSSPFSAMRTRAESVSSANSNSVDESPFEDDNASQSGSNSNSVPATPFTRRMSFGAQRTLRGSTGGGMNAAGNSGNANGRAPISSTGFANKASASSQSSKSRGLSCCSSSLSCNPSEGQSLCRIHWLTINSSEGYDFAEKLRARAERTSISNGFAGGLNQTPTSQPHQRSKSVAVMEPPKVEAPKQQRPDAFQERILKGDFYMD